MSFRENKNYWIYLIIILSLGWIIMWVFRQSLPTTFTEIGSDLNLNPKTANTQLGFIMTCFFIAYVIMQFPSGMLADKLGRKKILIPQFMLFFIATIIIANTKSISVIYFASFLAGLGCGGYYSIAFSLVADSVPSEKKSFAIAIINSGAAIGMTLTLVSASYLVKSLEYKWQIMMYIASVLIFVLIIAFILMIKEKSTAETTKKTEKIKVSFTFLFSYKMISMYFLYFATCYGYYMIVIWLPKYLEAERGIQGAAIGFSASLIAIASIPAALIFSQLSDKQANKKTLLIIVLQLVAIATLLGMIYASNETLLIMSLIAYGFFGKLAVEPLLISYLSEISPKFGQASILGMFNTCGMASAIIAPPLTGQIIDKTNSLVLGFYVSIVILILATINFIFFLYKEKNAQNLV